MSISFGTDGWRDIIARGFTFENLGLVVQAISSHLLAEEPEDPPLVVIGYDMRFLSPEFADHAAEVLLGNGLEVILLSEPLLLPLPMPSRSMELRGH